MEAERATTPAYYPSHLMADLTAFLQFAFYLVLLAKMVQLSFFFNRRLTVKERVVKKNRWAYCDYLKQLTQEDWMLM